MSTLRKERRKLRRVGKRIILDAYKRWIPGRLGVVSAPTCSGKTYNIQKELIPKDIEDGRSHFLYMTVYTDSVEQEYHDFEKSLRGIAYVTRDINEFLSWDHVEEELPIVLVITLAGAVNGGTDNENSEIVKAFLKDKYFSVYWDEVHFGGSSSKITAEWNLGHGRPPEYKGSYYKFAEELALMKIGEEFNGKVTGFTATALFEQQGLLDGIVTHPGIYAFLSKEEDWVTLTEFTDIASQIRTIVLYPITGIDGLVKGLHQAINDFRFYSEELAIKAATINMVHPEIPFTPKPVILINAGFANGIYTSIPLHECIEDIVKYLKDKVDNNVEIFGKVVKSDNGESGYSVASISDAINNTWKPIRDFKTFKKILSSHENSIQYVFHLEKFKVGLNLPNITHEVHCRERVQSGKSEHLIVTVSPIQIFGRAVRTWFGMVLKDKNGKPVNFVSDAVDWLFENYENSSMFDELSEYMKLANSHSFFVPNSITYQAATAQWRNPEKPYAVPIEESQFNIVRVNENLTSVPTGQERDLAYKKYKEKVRHCEQHPDGSCLTTNRTLDQFKDMSDEEFELEYWKALHVNHKDGNRNNMNEENLETICATLHMIITGVEGHNLNVYLKTDQDIMTPLSPFIN